MFFYTIFLKIFMSNPNLIYIFYYAIIFFRKGTNITYMNSFKLKIIACITMFIDHLRYIIPTKPLFMSYIGRIAFPIFAFQIAEGYSHTKNLKKYFFRLFILALISQVPYSLYFNKLTPNIVFTLLLGIITIYIYDNMKNHKTLQFTSIFFILILSEVFHCDYSYYGITIILIFHILKDKKIAMTSCFGIATFIYFFIIYKSFFLDYRVILLCICTFSAIIPCLLYNGKQGKKMKYLFYIFYPAHLLFLLMLTYL